MNGLLLRLAGPMQSWGDHSTFSVRDTRAYPTRSAMIGLFAAALGHSRDTPIDTPNRKLSELGFTIRVDRPGSPIEDFHTVGGGLPAPRTVITAEGNRRPAGTGTIVSRRHHLSDAVFTVAVLGSTSTITAIAQALTHPIWAPYLGRRSCPAEVPLLLRGPTTDALNDLYHRVPLARTQPHPTRAGSNDTVDVDFVVEQPPTEPATAQHTYNDVPVDFHPHRRSYLSRPLWVTTEKLPAELCAGLGGDYLTALDGYLQGAAS